MVYKAPSTGSCRKQFLNKYSWTDQRKQSRGKEGRIPCIECCEPYVQRVLGELVKSITSELRVKECLQEGLLREMSYKEKAETNNKKKEKNGIILHTDYYFFHIKWSNYLSM